MILRKVLTAVCGLGAASTMILAAPIVKAGDEKWMIRSSIIQVDPDSKVSSVLGIRAENVTTVSTDVSYFFTPNLALNVLAAFVTPEIRQPSAANCTAGSCGSIDLLPPIVTVQWHFAPDGKWRPYVGGGFNYNRFSNPTGTLNAINTDIGNEFGVVIAGGVDIMLTKQLSLNLDLKRIDLEVDVTTALGKDKVTLDPVILGVGLGYRF